MSGGDFGLWESGPALVKENICWGVGDGSLQAPKVASSTFLGEHGKNDIRYSADKYIFAWVCLKLLANSWLKLQWDDKRK